MEKIVFKKGEWEDKLVHTYTERFVTGNKFVQEEDCVRNPECADSGTGDGYSYITLMTKEKFSVGAKVSLNCSFESYGAPLIVFTDNIFENEKGDLCYADCFEVVLWEKGINVWQLHKENGKILPYLLMSDEFSVSGGDKHELFVEVREKELLICVEGKKMTLRVCDFPEEYYIGVTACEGVNRLYNMGLE